MANWVRTAEGEFLNVDQLTRIRAARYLVNVSPGVTVYLWEVTAHSATGLAAGLTLAEGFETEAEAAALIERTLLPSAFVS